MDAVGVEQSGEITAGCGNRMIRLNPASLAVARVSSSSTPGRCDSSGRLRSAGRPKWRLSYMRFALPIRAGVISGLSAIDPTG